MSETTQEAQLGGLLAKTIQEQVIPLLLRVHPAESGSVESVIAAAPAANAAEVAQLVRLIVARDGEDAFAYVCALRDRGMALEAIYLNVFAPTARRLGELWDADLCDFTDVTVGLWRLQQLLHKLRPGNADDGDRSARPRRMLLVPEPGEQHTFGLIMVAEFFRRDGWDVWGGPLSSRQELVSLVQRESFSAIGLSLGCESRLEEVATTIRMVRNASRNPRLSVLVGGQPFIDHPERVAQVGADATAVDGQQAVIQANVLQPAAALMSS